MLIWICKKKIKIHLKKATTEDWCRNYGFSQNDVYELHSYTDWHKSMNTYTTSVPLVRAYSWGRVLHCFHYKKMSAQLPKAKLTDIPEWSIFKEHTPILIQTHTHTHTHYSLLKSTTWLRNSFAYTWLSMNVFATNMVTHDKVHNIYSQ